MNKFYPLLKIDTLSAFVSIAIGVFTVLILCYSLRPMARRPGLAQYYSCIVVTGVASILTVLSNNLILLLASWGLLGLTLYLLINMGDENSSKAARKALIIVGGADALMLLGIGVLYGLSGTFQMDRISVDMNSGHYWLAGISYLCVAIACFAKSGAMPFHTWIPGCAESAPIEVTAFLPASLDKLIGIYLLTRLSLNIFIMSPLMNSLLLVIGAFTIIAGVMMALVQHDMKKLLGYHAISQVGYMVLGLGTGNIIGIAGGIFHMLNHAIYKSCLFLTAGNVEYRSGNTDLERSGGLGKVMPVTFAACVIASLSISGVPPFNGFVSKWLVYQGLILHMSSGGAVPAVLGSLCLAAAMFGSGLTLASFMKLLHAVFMGRDFDETKVREIKEAPLSMILPPVILAGACVLFGVFSFPLKYFIFPSVSPGNTVSSASLPGIWSPAAATVLVILGLLLGLIIFGSRPLRSSKRKDAAFVGGELSGSTDRNRVTGADFYRTIQDIGVLKSIYSKAQAGFFDIYEQAKKLKVISGFLQYLHNGVLPSYLVWMLLGMVGLFWLLVR